MPKVVYTAAKGLTQETGSGFQVDATVGVTNGGFYAGFIPNAAPSTVTSGAVSVANYMSYLSVTGTQTFTLAAGTAVGQLKKIMCIVAASTPNGTLTIANPVSASTDTVLFTALGDTVDLMWNGSAWRILGAYNVASGNVTTPVVS